MMVRQHAPNVLSAASVVEATTFDTLKYGMALIQPRHLHVLGPGEVQQTEFRGDPDLQTKYDHHVHGRCYNLNKFPFPKDRLIDIKNLFVSLFTVWDPEQQREGRVGYECKTYRTTVSVSHLL